MTEAPRGDFWDEKIERMGSDELASLQLERLRWQVRRCWEGSPFYRERLDGAGLGPESIRSLDDIEKIPPVTKQELRVEQKNHPPFGRYAVAPPGDWGELHPSTGTTGVPVGTIWSRKDVENIADFTARTMWSFGVRPGDIVQNAFSYGLWVAGMSVHYATQKIGCFVIPIGATETGRQIFYMNTIGSTVILSTPSFGLYIGEKLRESGVDPQQLKIGGFGGEGGTQNPATRSRIEGALGIDAYDYFGLGEIGPTFASESVAKSGLIWAEDHHIVEVLDPETRKPVPEGEVGILVITHLTREATPMLRYWTNDYARLESAPSACGRTHRRSPGGVLGRHDDLVIYRGAKFYPVQVEDVVRSFPELSNEFRIEFLSDEETGRDRCVVVAEAATGEVGGAMAENLGEKLRGALQVTPEVEIRAPGSFERTTFKAQRFVDLRNPEK
ncbi:MAG: AMP-binding protein [Nitrospinota bacterium]|jgi:phenylacetate-CoA ligase|nr:AMP-binding protein [Nitrospinota bacterium]MDP7370082.1 AMP-binding protein [Nitrospinota bacterium]MDP7504304.1 AMP-binding protein [Nitrospinota bacterium]MDP7662688.1 AMP-binding protein [Nitrospinota bacterium]HJP12941.1 AMP-binding protein [Nitrospinota bacterium]